MARQSCNKQIKNDVFVNVKVRYSIFFNCHRKISIQSLKRERERERERDRDRDRDRARDRDRDRDRDREKQRETERDVHTSPFLL